MKTYTEKQFKKWVEEQDDQKEINMGKTRKIHDTPCLACQFFKDMEIEDLHQASYCGSYALDIHDNKLAQIDLEVLHVISESNILHPKNFKEAKEILNKII